MMLGARTGAWAKSGGVPTARDYVQDGLLAMWDGIENAGFGVHDSGARTWKDLIGVHDFVLPAGISFGEDCAMFTKSAGKEQSWGFYQNEILTIEVCGKHTSTAVGFAFQFTNGNAGKRIFAYLSTNNRGFQFMSYGNTMNRPAFGIRWSVAATFIATSTVNSEQTRTFYNGQSSPMNTGTTGWGAKSACIGYYSNKDTYAFVGEICSVRLYSRAITSAEVAANYAIDKARFNLP